MNHGLVISSSSGLYKVFDGQKIIELSSRGSVKRNQVILAGDEVSFSLQDRIIEKIYDRKNELIRPKIANVDFVILVTALVQPELNLNLLDRQLVALGRQNIRPLLVFTKIDLADQQQIEQFEQIKTVYKNIGYEVIDNIDKISKLIGENQVGVLMGQTGAGKSTLINQLIPNANQKTDEVSMALSRGKHTTRQTELLPFNSGWLADSPGFSSFEVFDMQASQLQDYFPEFVKYRVKCKFADCQHINEIDCKIKDEVGEHIASSRYQNYLDFYKLIEKRKV